jgi:glycosyltransferase involved in cell wall biosynthesis
LGPCYGAEKESFWESIDVLLFPSKYSNEAAPLVVYEAMAHGVPVIAWERGCLSDMVSSNAGLLVPREKDFVAIAVGQLLAWQGDPGVFTEMSRAAANEFKRQRGQHRESLESLLDELCPRTPVRAQLNVDRVGAY